VKRILLVASVLICILAGCKTVNAPLPAGAVNQVDATINESLQAAHAYVAQWQKDVASGAHVATATEKTVMTKVVTDLNIADPLYQQFHAALVANPGAGEPADLAAALAAVTSDLANLVSAAKTL
jgi:hypothetical protein